MIDVFYFANNITQSVYDNIISDVFIIGGNMGYYWFKSAMFQSFSVDGRARRSEFYGFLAYAITLTVLISATGFGLVKLGMVSLGLAFPCLSLVFVPALISALIRRLHDVGRNAGWLSTLMFPLILILIVTGFPDFAARSDKAFTVLLLCSLIGPIYVLVFTLTDSDDDNMYGYNPKSL